MAGRFPSTLKRMRSSTPTRPLSPANSEGSSFSSNCSEVSFCQSTYSDRRAKRVPLRIAIEGNIAAGKTTFINILKEMADKDPSCHWFIQPEPLEKWTKSKSSPSKKSKTEPKNGGGNLLEEYYKDQKRWAYTFEAYTFVTRMNQAVSADREVHKEMESLDLEENHASTITFFERSVYSSRLVFAENGYESGFLTKTEWALYCDWTSYLLKTVKELKLDGIVYLQCDPEICVERMKKRSRSEECTVPTEYLRCLHDKHENWLNGWMQQKKQNVSKTLLHQVHRRVEQALGDVPVLVLNCTKEFQHDPAQKEAMIEKLKKFIEQSEDFSEIENMNTLESTKTESFSPERNILKKKAAVAETLSDTENQMVQLPNIFREARS